MVDIKEIKNKALKIAKTAILTTAVMISSTVKAQPKTPKDDKVPDKDKIENFTKTPSPELKITETISYFNEKDGTYYLTPESAININDIKTPRQETKEYKKEQKEAFKNAPPDTIVIRSISKYITEEAGGSYSLVNKNVTTYNIDESIENIEQYLNKKNSATNKNLTESQLLQKTQERIDQINSHFAESVKIHEEQHRVNDKNNIYAPGLNPEQLEKLNCHDEISANIAQLIAINDQYKKKLASGASQDDALKIFSIPNFQIFSFYQDALKEGMAPDSDEAKKLMVQSTTKMWKEEFQERYSEQINTLIKNTSSITSTLIGNETEYKKRVEKIYDSIKENPLLKEQGINIGNLSKYIPQEDIELSSQQKQLANNITIKQTGFSTEEGKLIREIIPGNEKRDQKIFTKNIKNPKKLLRLIEKLRGREASKKTTKPSNTQNTNNNITQTIKQQGNSR